MSFSSWLILLFFSKCHFLSIPKYFKSYIILSYKHKNPRNFKRCGDFVHSSYAMEYLTDYAVSLEIALIRIIPPYMSTAFISGNSIFA